MDRVSKALTKELRLEDLQEPARGLADQIGLEKFTELVYNFGGLRIYLPKFESLVAPARDRLILQEFDGGNYNDLALRYGITEVWVRQIVNEDRLRKNQIKLF